jgi:uncharacterized membrane protein YfcA
VFLVGFSLLFLIKNNIIISPTNKNAMIGGSLPGFSAGLLGVGSAIRGLTMAAFNLVKSAFRAISACIDFVIDFPRTFVYYNIDYIQKYDLKHVPYLLVIGLLSSYIGNKALVYKGQNRFRRLSLLYILLIGLII